MFFTLLFNSLLALSEISVSFHTRPILLKHKSFSFYRPSAYALGLILADLPQVAVQTLLWSIVIYFMTGGFILPLNHDFPNMVFRTSTDCFAVLHLPRNHLLPYPRPLLLFPCDSVILCQSRCRLSHHRRCHPSLGGLYWLPDSPRFHETLVFMDPAY